jgi:hypothetical protein
VHSVRSTPTAGPAGDELMRLLFGLFLIVHGLVHLAVWVAPYDPAKSPFDPKHSWLLTRIGIGEQGRVIAPALAVACTATFVVAGLGVVLDAGWAPAVAIAAAALSLAVTVLTFHRWFVFNVVINLAIIVIAAQG